MPQNLGTWNEGGRLLLALLPGYGLDDIIPALASVEYKRGIGKPVD
jgi:hypothetical protein